MSHIDPFPTPSPSAKIPAPVELTEEEQDKYVEILKYFTELKDAPATEKNLAGPRSPITEQERMFLTKECFLRYLRATKWNVNDCKKRLESTIAWRREFGVDPETSLTATLVAPENETGKQVILGYDNSCRPCLYLKPGRQNTKPSHSQVQHLVYMLERSIDLMPSGQGQLALLIDFKPTKIGKQSKLPSISTGREVLHILQTHYPERLGKALLTNIPMMASIFLKMIYPFIDPMTREKLVYSEPFPNYVPKEQLDKDFGGEVDFEYVQDKYWPQLAELTASRRRVYKDNFTKLGAVVGLSEADLRNPHLDLKTAYNPLTDLGEKPVEAVTSAVETTTDKSVDALAEKVDALDVNKEKTEVPVAN